MTAPFLEADPPRRARSTWASLARALSATSGRDLSDDRALHRFSVEQPSAFWRAVVDACGMRLEGELEPVIEGASVESARFFPHARLSYVEHLLHPAGVGGDELAVIAREESGARATLSRDELRDRVLRVATALERRGVGPGDRVVAVCRNTIPSLIAHLATLALGALWSSVAPDMGRELILARVGQVRPKLFFVDAAFTYQGAVRSLAEGVLEGLAALPEAARMIALGRELPSAEWNRHLVLEPFAALLEEPARSAPLPRLPFDHPLVILFSSGTTGVPKCIVHGAGGTLLEHLKELRIHCDLGPGSRVLYHTTTGWMMYNWLVSALATGATIVLWDGSVTHPAPDQLLRVVAEERVTVFGTSATYLQYLRDAELSPRATLDLSALELVLSTGSVLREPQYDYVGEHLKRVPIHSISGGTDILGCFVLGSPGAPVYRGESPNLSLGLDVRVAIEGAGGPALLPLPDTGEITGELVCCRPFPSRPIGFFGEDAEARFHEAYFAAHPGVWTHGDTVTLSERGTARVLGRSDGILNVRGIRIGPSEIYRIVADCPEILEALAIEQEAPEEPGGTRLVLLARPREPGVLTRPVLLRLKKDLATRASQAHVPSVIAEVVALPRTHNGKLSERAARDAANGKIPKNLSALANPECLDAIREHPAIASARGVSS